ncbi:MAG: hypothetical protein M3O35_16975 [Acidobacteriota bacterium]|nr:hypothetical protein [Acidobacteriota bacterium]
MHEQTLDKLSKELHRTSGRIDQGNLRLLRAQESDQVMVATVGGYEEVLHMPEHLVLMLKDRDHRVIWANEHFVHVFNQSLANVQQKRADQLFRGMSGKAILGNEREVLRTGQANLYKDVIFVGRKKLRRFAIRFVFDSCSIGVACWGSGKSLIPQFRGRRDEEYDCDNTSDYSLPSGGPFSRSSSPRVVTRSPSEAKLAGRPASAMQRAL